MLFFVLLPIFTYFLSLSLRSHFAILSHFFHSICLQSLPPSTYSNTLEALVCAEPLKDPVQKEIFIQSGLYHVIVVSGSHLIFFCFFLELLLESMTRNRKGIFAQTLILFTLFIYTLACNLEPPLIRACFSYLLGLIGNRLRLNYNSVVSLLISVLLCLVFEPSWILSRSLLLSSIASLSLILTKKNQNPFLKQLLIYLTLAPALWGWGNLHPLTILTNIFLAPLISLTLLPMALITIPFHSLSHFLDILLKYSFQFLSWISQPAFSFLHSEKQSSLSLPVLWSYFLLLLTSQYLLHLHTRRDQA